MRFHLFYAIFPPINHDVIVPIEDQTDIYNSVYIENKSKLIITFSDHSTIRKTRRLKNNITEVLKK